MATLSQLTISGFKSIREMPEPLKLSNLNVLIGANGAGKSNLLSFLKMVVAINEQRFQDYVGRAGFARVILHRGCDRSNEITSNLQWISGSETTEYQFRIAKDAEDRMYFANERVRLLRGSNMSSVSSMDRTVSQAESELEDIAGTGDEAALHVVDAINGWEFYHFHDTSPNSPLRAHADLHDNRYLREDGANLSAFLYYLRERENRCCQRVIETIQLVAPFIDNFVLEPSRLNKEKIILEWKHRGSDGYFNSSQLSDGTLRFICLATLLLQPEPPGLILIDEPELGLHPYAISILAALLRKAALKTQVIVATQSVELADEVKPEDVIVVDRADGQSVFKRLDSASLAHWLEDYSLGEIWLKNIVGGHPGPELMRGTQTSAGPR